MTGEWPERVPAVRDLATEANGWVQHAEALALFADAQLVNRRDVWGAYIAPERRVIGEQYTYTAPGKKWRGTTKLDAWRLAQHFRGASQGHVKGLHSTADDDTSRWGGCDFDAHDAPQAAYLVALRDAAVSIVERLAEYGAAPVLEDSNGVGGWHVWVYFDAPVPTADVYTWLDALAERARLAFGVAIETYPKQASARGGFGNWLRLPGRHHSKAHWSRVARPGESWASGADAARVLLSWPSSPAGIVPPASVWPLRSVGAPVESSSRTDLPAVRSPVIADYVSQLGHGAAGSGRSIRLFHLARFLRHRMRATETEAFAIMRAWNAHNSPPLPESKLSSTWENAETYNTRVPLVAHDGGRHAA